MLAVMSLPFLFGPTSQNNSSIRIQPRVYDIDVVRDVYQILDTEASRVLAAYAASPEYLNQSTSAAMKASQDGMQERLAIKPKLSVGQPDGAMSVIRDVPFERLDSLGAHERSSLCVVSGEMTINFREGGWTGIEGAQAPYVGHLASSLASHLEAEGRRRVQWRPMVRFVPLLFALALSAVGIWAVIDARPELPVVLFGAICVLAAWLAVGVLQPRLTRRFRGWSTGHRFREGSRAAVRERLVNARATTIVSVVTIPVGAVLGFLLKLWLGD